ncbi:MAG: TrmH family RNA methyltransferase [Mycoplasmatales bacterium]
MKMTSLNNNKVKYAAKLFKSSKFRTEENKFLVYGEHLVQEALNKNLVEQIFHIEEIKYVGIEVSQEVIKKILGGINANICAVCFKEEKDFEDGHVLILDYIQDPGNLGTIIRSAKAFDFKNILISKDSVDLYNEKVLRATQGAFFNMNIKQGDIKEYLSSSNNLLVTTYLNEENEEIDLNQSLDLIFGNEGNGLKEDFKQMKHVNTKVETSFDSLNVGVAASIIIHNISKGK